ncbi:MAG TPA: hypothetical protein V6D28_06650 [Leptolyngbyaceae cyanobacterium]
MNKLSQIVISATAGSLVTLAITVSPLFAQNKTSTPTPPAHSTTGMPDHQQMMGEMSQMMEKCQSMMGNNNKPTGSQHNQHHPSNTNPTSNLGEHSLDSRSIAI